MKSPCSSIGARPLLPLKIARQATRGTIAQHGSILGGGAGADALVQAEFRTPYVSVLRVVGLGKGPVGSSEEPCLAQG